MNEMYPIERYLRRELQRAMKLRSASKDLQRYTEERGNELRAEQAKSAPAPEPVVFATTPEYRHWYRLTEWPVALCGHLCPYATLREATQRGHAQQLATCPECRRLDMIRLGVKP